MSMEAISLLLSVAGAVITMLVTSAASLAAFAFNSKMSEHARRLSSIDARSDAGWDRLRQVELTAAVATNQAETATLRLQRVEADTVQIRSELANIREDLAVMGSKLDQLLENKNDT